MFERKLTKKITVGGVEIGALSPVSVQSMCNTKTHDVEACLLYTSPSPRDRQRSSR